jgi:hypothetical protein
VSCAVAHCAVCCAGALGPSASPTAAA